MYNLMLNTSLYKFSTLTLLLGVFFLSGCSVNPVTGKKEVAWMPEQWEVNTGKQYYPLQQQASGGQYELDPALTRYVQGVGQRLVKHTARSHLPYEFVVINDSTPNAWALPGGKIAINRGLITQLNNEAELAAVLAHEIVHAAARHSAQGQEVGSLLSLGSAAASILLSKSGYSTDGLQKGIGYAGLFGQQKYSRSRELQADHYGMQMMSKAGYDPTAAIELQKLFVELSKGRSQDLFSVMFASHPPSINRVRANQSTANDLPLGGELGKQRFAEATRALKSRQAAYDLGDEAKLALSDKNYKQAINLADQAIKLEKHEGLFYEIKAAGLIELNRSKDALTALNEAVALNPKYFSPLLRRGLLKHELKSYQGAEADIQRSLTMIPTQVAYMALGDIAERKDNCRNAINYYQLAAQQRGNYTEQSKQKLQALAVSCRQ